jgi:hypothetical protein
VSSYNLLLRIPLGKPPCNFSESLKSVIGLAIGFSMTREGLSNLTATPLVQGGHWTTQAVRPESLVTRPLVKGGHLRGPVNSMANAPDPRFNRIWLDRYSSGVGVVALLLAEAGKVVQSVVVLRETVLGVRV